MTGPERAWTVAEVVRTLRTAVESSLGQVWIKGELRELAAAADPATRTYAARIRIVDAPASLQLGMTARVAFAGSGSEASRLCMDKVATKARLRAAGVPVAPELAFDRSAPHEIVE